jgi:uncharacterized protein
MTNSEELFKKGQKYYYGHGVKPDRKEAVKWYLLSAEQGNAKAQYSLGYCYGRGQGIEKDLSEAVKWYTLSAELGNANAQEALGDCYGRGLGVEQNFIDAVKWYRLSALQGNVNAAFYLARFISLGAGIAKNLTEGAKWLRLAADLGHIEARFFLGVCYDSGEGVEQNYEEAAKLFKLALDGGIEDAKDKLNTLLIKLVKQDKDKYLASASGYVDYDIRDTLLHLTWAIENDPNFAEAYCFRGECWEKLEQFEKAILDFDNAISIDPKCKSTRGMSVRDIRERVMKKKENFKGIWISAEEHHPTGNFLDDVFRHSGLSHDDRVEIWKQITTDSLPCVMIKELEFCDIAWYGSSDENYIDFEEAYELLEIKENKPVYYYTSDGLVYVPGEDKYDSAGIAVHHQGIGILWESNEFIHWDQINNISDPIKEGNLQYIRLSVNDGAEVIIGLQEPKGNNRTQILPEIQNLTSVMRIRLEQTRPFRKLDYMNEDPGWYRFLEEKDSRQLCEDYIKNKKPPSENRQQHKTGVNTKHSSLKEVDSDSRMNESPETIPVNSVFKPVSGTKSVSSNPVTYLEFWQVLKASLDKLRFKGFANVKLIEYEWLNCKPNIIVGVYHSVGIIKTKKKIRLDCYIDTATDAGNLQIIDYVKSHYKPAKSIKERMVFDRKEGRRAQRISLYLDNFDLDDRSCWGRYIKEFVSVADDFIDAIDTQLKELI